MEGIESSIHRFTSGVDTFTSNEQLVNNDFAQTFNSLKFNLENNQSEIFRHLKLSLKNIYYVKTRERAFDLHLKENYSSLISFLATLDLEPNIKDLFKDFVGQKNLFFYDIKSIFRNLNDLTVLIINLYDIVEESFQKMIPAEVQSS